MATLPHLLVFTLLPWLVLGALWQGPWTWTGVGFVLLCVPIMDALGGLETRNPTEDAPRRRAADLPLWLWAPAQIGVSVFAIVEMVRGDFAAWEQVGMLLSLGVVNGAAGITIAHELMHRRRAFERASAEALMLFVSYPHFCVEHVHGHHRHVATPADPASSRFGESIFAFYPRVVLGSLRSFWRIESARVAKQKPKPWADRRIRYALLWVGLLALVTWTLGPWGLLYFLVQGVIAFSLLEIINYIEHYGLERAMTASGRYERVRPQHSWNSAHRISNWYLFNLARHSDHHYLASRPYDQLRHYEDVPQLPAGYATMLLTALVPPLWFRVMNPRVEAWNAQREAAARESLDEGVGLTS